MSFADEYMALRAKRLAEIKETGKVQETPVEHTAPAGGGAVSDFGARYMALRQKRIADGYKTLTAPPDLGGRGPKAPFAIGSDPFGRKPVVEQIRKNDPQGEKYRAYYKTYNSGGADMLGLSQKISQDTKRIAELERELTNDQYTLDNWPGAQPGHTPSKEMLDEQAVVWKRMERNRMELAGLRKESPEREEEYAAYWAFSFADMQNSDESNRKGYAIVGNNLRGDVGEVYRTLMYNEEPTRRDLEKSTVESVKIYGNTLDMGKLARMTKEEKALFFYLCNMGETQKAEALLHEISGYLAQRYSDDLAEATDIPVLREAIALASSAGKGVKNIGYGFASMFADLDVPEISEGERMQTYWQEKHKGTLAGYTTGAASTIGNMMPAIAGYAVNPVVGSMATFFNTRGNAYAEAKRDGANHEQAWLYSTLTGAAETGLQTLLGRAGGLISGKIPGAAKDFVSKFASKISSKKFGKLMLDWVIDVGAEEIEENLQSFLDPAFKMFANISDHYEAPTWEEITETTIVTAISSTIFFGVNQRQESRNAKWQSEYTAQVKETMEAWEKLQTGAPFYEASQALRRHFAENEDISPVEFRDILLKYGAENAPDSEATDPNWEQYEQEHEGERFQYDPTSEKVDQLEDMRGWREDTYEQAQSYTDRELTHAIEEKRAIRDDESQENKSRAIAQHHLDALEYTQMQRQNNNAALNEQRVEGVKYSGAEGLNDSGQRSAGVGAQGQTGGMAEGTGRSIPRGQGKTEKAIVEDIRGNAAAQSARGIGIIGGSESADLRVIPVERINESESWSRIRDEVEAKGQKMVLVVGKMETVDPVTKKVYTHEGIRQVNADGTVTYYIKADKITRNAEQIYKHEDFHDIVDYNPQLLPGLVKALEDQYGKQELMSLIYSYVEAFEGIYGTFEDDMTEKAQRDLVMKYAEEIFADAYGEINRGRKNIENAKQALRDQTDRVQRAAQNRRAVERKTAPPGQRFSLSPTKRQNLEKEIDRLGTKRIGLLAGNKKIVVLTDDFTKNKAIYSQKGRTKREVNARIKAIPDFESIIRSSQYDDTDTKIRNLESKAKKGVIAIHHFVTKYEGFDIDIVIRDKGNVQFLYEVKFIEHKKSPKQSMTDKPASTAPDGDVWDDDILTDDVTSVKQNFSVDDSELTLEDRVSGDDYLNALDLIEEIKLVGAQVDSYGYVTLYHRTSDAAAKAIYRTGVMTAKEDGLFFSTNASGANNYAYGNSVVELKVPAEMLVLDDIFADEASIRIPLEGRRRMNVSEYLVRKGNAETQKFSVDDEAYLSAVEDGDMETAQRMVEEAAKKAGFSVRAYHGTPNGTFHEFRDWQYFTESREYADTYQNQSASVNYKKTAAKPRTYDVFLKPGKVFDTRQARERKIFETQFYRQWGNGAPLSDRGLPDWTDGDDFVEFFEEEGYDYTAILLDEGGTGGYGEEVKDRGISYVIKSSEQIKSADPVTYDDNGNVIPLSQRFNQNKTDIRYSIDDEARELDEGYARAMEEDGEPEGAPSDQQIGEQYDQLAKGRKEQNAKDAPLHTLKSRIASAERRIAILQETKKSLQGVGGLTAEVSRSLDSQIEKARETLKIDRTEWQKKWREHAAEEKKKDREKKEKEIATQKARTAQKELKQDLLNLFSVRDGTRTELGDLIDKLSDKMLAQGHLSHEDRKNLFDALMDHGEKLSNPDEYFQNVRSFMTQGRIYVSEEVRAKFGDDWKAFRNRAWGNRIYLTSDETDVEIDVWTECLKTEFGGQFSGENDLKTQLEMIVDLAEEGKPERLTIAEMMQREMNEFGWSVEEQVEELEGKVDKLLEIYAQKADLEIRLRQQSLRQRMKDYDLYRTMQENKRQSAMENQARKNVMSAIQKLNKMRKRASPDQRAAIDEALKGIDVVARSISASGLEDLQELARLYNEQREVQGANFLSSPYVEARLARLGQKQIDDMDIEEVVELGRMVCSITNAIQNSNKLLASARKEDVYATARKAEEEIWNSEGSKDGRLRKLTLNHLDGKRFFGQISGWVNGVVERLGEALSTGQERQMRYQMNAMRIFDKFLSNEENQAFMKTASGKDAKWIKVAVPKGFKTQNRGDLVETSEIEITPMMRISLLLHSKNEDNLRHIMTGGIRIPNKEQYRKGNMGAAYDKGIRVKMDPATVRAIVKGCTEQEKAFARLCESYFNGMAKDYINEVSMVLDGFERAGGEHYYHIKTDPAFLAKQNDAVKRDLSVAATASVVNERVHASNPIVLQDATDALMEHIESISKYYGYAVPIRDLNAVLGQSFHGEENAFNGSVLETLKQKWGGSAEAYIDKLMADLQLPDSSKDYLSDFMVKLRGNYARAVISANLSSLLKQTTSYPVALPYLKMDGLIHGLAFKNMAQDIKTLEKYSAVYWYRNQGNSTAELSDVLKRREFGDALPWLFNATQKMDSWTTRRILAACEYRVQKDMGLMPGTQAEIDAGTDRYWSEVAKLFNDVVLKTQSNSTMMERPQITRANASNISRFLTMFRTDAYQQYNMMVEAVGRLRAAKKDFSNTENADNKKALSNARRFATRTIVGTLIGQIGCALVGVLLKKLRYDDEEFVDEEGQWDWGKVAGYIGGSVVEGYCGFITCGEWLYAAVEASLDKSKKWWDIDVSGLSVIDDVATAGINLVRALTSANLWEGKGAAKDFALALLKMAGIPAENMEKYLYMCLRWVAPEFVTIRENFWNEITKSDLSKESRKTIREAVSVLMDNRAEGLADHDKDEIARIYMAGGVGAVPAGIPTSISYTNEDGEQIAVDLTAGQQKQYRELWSDIVSEEIGKILETDAYKEADDEGKTELIAKLYSYANALIAHELVPEKEVAKWVLQGETAQENGIPLGEYIAFRVGLSDVTGKDDAGETVTGLKAQRSMELIEAMGWSDQQEESVWLDVVASDSVGAATKALTDAGVPWDIVNNLVVMTGGKTEKLVAIGEAKLSDQVKVKAMSVYAGDLEKKMLSVGLKYGVKPEWYTEVLKNANADSKGGISQSEAREYILGMGLSLQDMAVLFQMVTDAKEGKSNPFYPSYAELFWYDVHEDDPE